MQSKLRLFSLLLVAGVFISSCIKHDFGDTSQPVLIDTLGSGWQAVRIDTTLSLSDIFFVNNQVGYVCGSNYLGKSLDGGLTWTPILADSLEEDFINLYFSDANNGWITGADFLLRTKDGGSTWQKAYTAGPTFAAQFFDANNGYVSTYGDVLYKTNDGGVTAHSVNNSLGHALFFLDSNRGWVAGPYLYKTTNAGATFTQSSTNTYVSDYAVQFTDTLHGWVAGPVIYRTTDGGATLTTIAADLTTGGDINFFDNNNGYVASGNNIYSTTDGGQTLTKQCAIHKDLIYEIYFTDINHGWATGPGGYVYRYVKP
jgi:photosystem II stability/assembly factor-like uncharacterized protein